MESRFCPRCGLRYAEPDMRFCPTDGARLLDAALPALLRGRLLAGRFQLETQLGRGGMGSVYRATDIVTGTALALKILNPDVAQDADVVERFAREAKSTARVVSPHVARIYEFGHDRGIVYLAMELVDGESLRQRLTRSGALSVSEAARIGHDIAAALEAAHAAGVLHRDLKPDNIMLASAGGLRILDFGIARVADGTEGARLTKGGMRLGSPVYMSPEAVRGGELSARSDLYSLGVVLYEAITGRVPFESSKTMNVIGMHLHTRPESVAVRCPEAAMMGLASLVDDLLEKSPDDRPQCAAEVRTYLSALL